MLNEGQNDLSQWKDKLEDLTSLPPGEMMDKNAAWKKLYDRLRDKPRNRKLIWYWAAAACLLLAFLLPVVISRWNANNVPDTSFRQSKKESESVSHTIPVQAATNVETVRNIAVEKRRTGNVIKKTNNNDLLVDHLIIKDTNSKAYTINPAMVHSGTIANPVLPVDTALFITATTPAKKKFHVIHINEVEDFPNGVVLSAPDRQQNTFLSFGKSNHITNQPAPATHDYAGIIKIKISSQN